MIDLKKITDIFQCFNFEKVLDKLHEGKAYLENGEEEFPIDLADSVRFLEDLEELFESLVYSDHKKCDFVDNGVILFRVNGNENSREHHLRDFDTRFRVLKAEMGMVLTLESMERYLSITEFVDKLLAVLKGKRK